MASLYSLYGLTKEEQIKFDESLSNAGFDLEMALALLNYGIAVSVVRTINGLLKEQKEIILSEHPFRTLVYGQYITKKQQLWTVSDEMEKRGWGFTKEEYGHALCSQPPWPDDPNVAVILVPYLETIEETFKQLSSLAGFCVPRYDSISLAANTEYKRGLKWEVVNLMAPATTEVCGAVKAHASILAAVWLFPRWIYLLRRYSKPLTCLWMGGFVVDGRKTPQLLIGNNQDIKLRSDWFYAHENDIVPIQQN